MQLEQGKPNKPSFGMVVFCSGIALLVIFVIAVLLIGHYRRHQTPPYTQHPVSQRVPTSSRVVNLA